MKRQTCVLILDLRQRRLCVLLQDGRRTSRDGRIFCNYQGERMTYDSASAICQANGMEQAYPQRIKEWACGPCCDGLVSPQWWKDDERFRSWSNSDCGLRVKVELSSGQVAIVHSP